MKKRPGYTWNPDDHLSSPWVETCDLVDEGIYRRLLDFQWKSSGCQLPDDIKYLRKLCKQAKRARVETVLVENFRRIETQPGVFVWRNERLYVEFTGQILKSQKALESVKHRIKRPLRQSNDSQTIDRKPIEKSSPKPRQAGAHQQVVSYFFDTCKARRGFPPIINAKDAAVVKHALSFVAADELKRCIDWFFDSDKGDLFGVTLAIALSSHSINSYLASLNGGKSNDLKERFNRIFGVCDGGPGMAPDVHREADYGRHDDKTVDGAAGDVSQVETGDAGPVHRRPDK